MKRKWDSTDQKLNQQCLDEVIARIQDIEDVDRVGIIAAQEIVDIVVEKLAPEIYNKGIYDTKKLLQDKVETLENDIELLKQ